MNPSEQRQERRLSLSGLQLEVRRLRWRWFVGGPVTSLVDLSTNGLSFVSPSDCFSSLDKVNFVLKVGDLHIRGSGVVCHKQPESGGRWRYGLMFLNVSREVEALLKEIEYEPDNVRAIAEKMADRFLLSGCRTESEQIRLQKQLLLWEAATAFIERLSVFRQAPLPVQVTGEGILLNATQPACEIRASANRPGYSASTGEHFANVFEVLDFVSQNLD